LFCALSLGLIYISNANPACSCVYICKFQFRPIHPPSRRLSLNFACFGLGVAWRAGGRLWGVEQRAAWPGADPCGVRGRLGANPGDCGKRTGCPHIRSGRRRPAPKVAEGAPDAPAAAAPSTEDPAAVAAETTAEAAAEPKAEASAAPGPSQVA
jgi:hypothetical protein